MSTILVIADQPRTQELVASAMESAPVEVKFVVSLKHAEEVPADFPAMLLIQDRISGLSGEILARHLRSIFPDDAISVVLLTDEPASAGKMRFIDDCIDLRRADNDVVKAIQEAAASRLKEESAEVDASPTLTADVLAHTVVDRIGVSGDQQPKEGQCVPSPFNNSFESALSDQSHVPLHLVEKEQELENRQRQTAESLLESPPKRQLRWLYLAIAIALAASLYVLAGGKDAPTKKRSAPPAPAPSPLAKPNPEVSSLPPLVPVKGLDPGYSKRHPGWERYTDDSQEYKIYRKDAAILALQIIDHSGKGLSTALIERVLQETTRNKGYTIASTSPKEGFLVEKGTAAGMAKIIIYKRQSDGQVRGMVLHFD